MTREDLYMSGCLFAVNRLIDDGSSSFAIRVNDKWEIVPWDEIREWIEKRYGIEQEAEE